MNKNHSKGISDWQKVAHKGQLLLTLNITVSFWRDRIVHKHWSKTAYKPNSQQNS